MRLALLDERSTRKAPPLNRLDFPRSFMQYAHMLMSYTYYYIALLSSFSGAVVYDTESALVPVNGFKRLSSAVRMQPPTRRICGGVCLI